MAPSLADEVHEAVEVFMKKLDQIAKDHKRCVHSYYATSLTPHNDPKYSPQEQVRLLGGFGGFRKAKQRSTSPFGAWLSKKIEEENRGGLFLPLCFRQCSYIILLLDKHKGDRTTLQDLLQRYRLENSDDDGPKMLHDEYNNCDKEAVIDDFKVRKAQEAEENAVTKVKNISISKKVYAKLGNITASVRSYPLP